MLLGPRAQRFGLSASQLLDRWTLSDGEVASDVSDSGWSAHREIAPPSRNQFNERRTSHLRCALRPEKRLRGEKVDGRAQEAIARRCPWRCARDRWRHRR